jgi:hypothetical protein
MFYVHGNTSQLFPRKLYFLLVFINWILTNIKPGWNEQIVFFFTKILGAPLLLNLEFIPVPYLHDFIFSLNIVLLTELILIILR